jgi:recombination protein RecT
MSNDIIPYIEGEEFGKKLARVLPVTLTPAYIIRVVNSAVLKNPAILGCTRASVETSILNLGVIGLEPDGRNAHLIPYKGVCTPVIDWKGLVQLALRSGKVASIHADNVFEGDLFEYDTGVVIRHVPWYLRGLGVKHKKGAQMASYVIATLSSGAKMSAVIPLEDVQAIRRRSKSPNAGPWVTDFEQMSIKTVIRRGSKYWPITPEFSAALALEDDYDSTVSAPAAAPEIRKVEAIVISAGGRSEIRHDDAIAATGVETEVVEEQVEPAIVAIRAAAALALKGVKWAQVKEKATEKEWWDGAATRGFNDMNEEELKFLIARAPKVWPRPGEPDAPATAPQP